MSLFLRLVEDSFIRIKMSAFMKQLPVETKFSKCHTFSLGLIMRPILNVPVRLRTAMGNSNLWL